MLLRCNPEVAKVLKSADNKYLQELEEILGRTVLVKADERSTRRSSTSLSHFRSVESNAPATRKGRRRVCIESMARRKRSTSRLLENPLTDPSLSLARSVTR